jgi:hypothetical protein
MLLQGFFNQMHECKVLDFAGGMVVHMLGGLFGLVGAYKCGPRLGRFEMLGQDDYDDDDSPASTASCDNTDSRGSGGDLVDSASELAGTNTPPSDRLALPELPADPAPQGDGQQQQELQQQQQELQQQLQALRNGRSLHTLLPPIPASADSASSSRGVVLEMGQLGPGGFKQPGSGQSSSAADIQHAAADNDGAVAQQQDLAAGHISSERVPAQAAAATGQGAAAGASSNSTWSSWFSKLGWKQRQQQRRRRRRRQIRHGDTSAATCGSGICKFVPKAMPGHDMAFVTLGTFMLWFGWFGFNNGSVYMYVNGNPTPAPGSLAGAVSAEVVQRTSMNTALGGSAAGLTSLLCAALFWGE